MIPRWLSAMFRRPKHIPWTPNPTHTLLTACPWPHLPVCQHVVGGPGWTVTTTFRVLSLN